MQPLIILHGAMGASSQYKEIAGNLDASFRTYTPDFAGHGGRADDGTPFSMKRFAEEVLVYMEQEQLERVSIFGYSMGGYVGMYLARHFPERIGKVVTLATKYHWDEAIAAKEVQLLNPEKIEQKVPAFAEALKKLHTPGDWKQLMHKTADMLTGLGQDNSLKPEDYPAIQAPALLLLGDRDKMVSLEETVAVYKALPNGQMGVLPGTPHPIEQVNKDMLCYFIGRFLQ